MRIKLSLWLLALLIPLSLSVYFSPAENSLYDIHNQAALAKTIRVGRDAAWALYDGNTRALLALVDESASSIIVDSQFRQVSLAEVYDKLGPIRDQVNPDLSYAVLIPDVNDFELMALDRFNGFAVLTFAYSKPFSGILEIPGKKKLLFTVALKYYRPFETTIAGKLWRKFVNQWVMQSVLGDFRSGTTGRWILIDFRFNHNRAELYEWLMTHGVEAESERRLDTKAGWEKLQEELRQEGWDAYIEEESRPKYERASKMVDRQITELERSLAF